MRQLLCTMMLMGFLTSARAAEGPDPVASGTRTEPCYVVIAVDASASLESVQESGPGGKGPALRDEGQLIFLQLLPFLRSDLYIGVTHFSDRIRYSLPSRETGPLLPWGRTFLSESACRNLVKPVELQVSSRPDIAESMGWAADRIQAARQQYGRGPAKLILLSRGDPRDSAREMERGRGPLLTMAQRCTEQQIQVYPVLFEDPPLRSGTPSARSAGRALAVEGLMHSMALMTGGKAYRLSSELAVTDILLDIFDLGTPILGEVTISPHDWALVVVGAPVATIAVTPSGGGSRRMALDESLEATCGIRSSSISSAGYRTTILRRPGTRDFVDRFWQGRWTIGSAAENTPSAVRVYRIPDYLIQLEMTPPLPWWLHEQVQLRARLLDRHPQTPESAATPAPDSGRGLSIHMKASSADGESSFVVDQGHWTTPGRLYETEPFVVRTPGMYKLAGQLRHAVGEVNAPVLHFAGDVYVHPACVGLELVSAATNEVLREVPPQGAKLWIDTQGGQELYVRLVARGEMQVEPMGGTINLEPLPQSPWTLRKQDNGSLIAGPIQLAEREERLTGSAEVEVRTFAGVRHLRLPAFELTYTPAPLRLACSFTDPREALWVGELHRQPVTISAFPVFEPSFDQTMRLFPESLAGMHLRTIDLRSGTTQVVSPDNRLLEHPQPGGYAGRTLTATYFVESGTPIPPADKCEVDLGGVLENLQGAVKTYAVVDPLAKGLFEWVVQQEGVAPRQGPVSETLFCGEPVLFFAGWKPDQNVSAVRFEIPRPNSTDSIFVDMPVAPGTNKTQLEQVVPGLTAGQTLPIYVHVTMQPAPADRPLEIKLKGGQFRTEDRRIVLEELTVGGGTPADIGGYVWEPVDVPVRATFRGYRTDNLAHHAALEQFKKSCVATIVAPRAPRSGRTGAISSTPGDTKNITDTIEWTSMTPPAGATGAWTLAGHIVYTPEVLGRTAIELTVEAPAVRGATGPSSQRAYAHVLAREPRLTIAIGRLKPGGEEPIFDSRNWVRGQDVGTPVSTRLSTRLRVEVQSADWMGTGQAPPWKTTLRLLRRPVPNGSWSIAFSDMGELTPSQSLVREVQIAEQGQYVLEMVGQDPQSNKQTVYVLTPVLASIQPHEVTPAMTPPAWLTSRVRQWPFEYLVSLYRDTVDLSRPQALAFQFQLPGQRDVWLDGATAPLESAAAEVRQLRVKAPRLLPITEGLRNGVARFRLSAQGLEILRWECPNVRVIPPVLEGLMLSSEATGAALASTGGVLNLDGSGDLWIRPQFRAAPELEGQWAVAQAIIFLWRDSSESPGGPAEVRVLERLQEQEKSAAGHGIQTYPLETKAGTAAVKVLSRRAPRGFWGWPKRAVNERYSAVASVVYRPSGATDPASGPSDSTPAVVEWSDMVPIHLTAPWIIPACWWPVVGVLLIAVVVMVLRVLVPSPSRLPLDLRLEENVAVVEPVRLDNPVLLDLKETSLAQELVLYSRFLCGQWAAAGRNLARLAGRRTDSTLATLLGRFLETVAALVAPVWVLLRRSLYPRRWAWATVVPRIRGNAASARTGLLCVWTGLGARRGRVWCSQAGSLKLPEEGQTRSINLDLPYRIDSVDRTMRVTVRVRRMGAEEVRTLAAN